MNLCRLPRYQDETRQLTENYTYDALGRILTETNAKGEVTNYTYRNDAADNKIRIVEKTKALEGGKISKTVETYGAASNYAYPTIIESYYTDDTGSLTSTRTNKTYNMLLGLVESETDNSGNTTNYIYDNIGRIWIITLPNFKDMNGETYSARQYFNYYEGWNMNELIQYFTSAHTYYTDTLKDYIDTANKGLRSTFVHTFTTYEDKYYAYAYQHSVSAYDGFGSLRQEEEYYSLTNGGPHQWIVKSRNILII